MIRIRVNQPGQAEQVLDTQATEVLLGRSGECDLVIEQPHVSSRHAKLLHGLVLVDLESRNGTFVGGQRVVSPVVIDGEAIVLGGESGLVTVRVEVLGGQPGGGDGSQFDPMMTLPIEAFTGLKGTGPARSEPERLAEQGAVEALREELWEAKQRIEALKSDLLARDNAGSDDLQFKLARQEFDELRLDRDALAARIQQLETELSQASGPVVRESLSARIADLESQNAQRLSQIERFQQRIRELEEGTRASKSPDNVSELFFRLQAENAELRRELEQRGAGPEKARLSELQRELGQLRAQLASQGAPVPVVPAVPAVPAGAPGASATEERGTIASLRGRLESLEKENSRLLSSKADLAAELDRLRSRPAPQSRVAGVQVASGSLISEALDEDFERSPVENSAPADRFLFRESLRFLKVVERAIIKSAHGHIQILTADTLLPETQCNLQVILGELAAHPDSSDPRVQLVNHFTELKGWLATMMRAHPEAAERFVDEIRHDLSEARLLASKPMPGWAKVAGRSEAELWRRVSSYLGQMTVDVARERMGRLVRECAEEFRRRPGF